jgi:hypothetical protein
LPQDRNSISLQKFETKEFLKRDNKSLGILEKRKIGKNTHEIYQKQLTGISELLLSNMDSRFLQWAK